ncbi:hypothetical protein VCHENC02_2073, partial [Vibrio harveyi]
MLKVFINRSQTQLIKDRYKENNSEKDNDG